MFVTGCHRSGTSLVASLLVDLLGQSSVLTDQLAAQPDNPQGFFESQQLVDLNNELLAWLGRDWSTPPLVAPSWDSGPYLSRLEARRNDFKHWSLHRDWVDKDPRLCITYPAFFHLLLKRIPLVGVLRSPLEVATSLYARNGLPINSGLSLWFLYNHHLSAVMDSSDCLLTYDSVLSAVNEEGSSSLLTRVAPMLDHVGVPLPSDEQWTKLLSRRLRPDLNRAQSPLSHAVKLSINPALLSACQRAYEAVSRNGYCDASSFYDSFECVPRDLLVLLARQGSLHNVDESVQQCEDAKFSSSSLSQALIDSQNELELLKSSRSWKITSPLRAFANCLRSAK